MVSITFQSETATGNTPAIVRVYEDGKLIGAVEAKVELRQGADGGFYHLARLSKVEDLKSIPE